MTPLNESDCNNNFFPLFGPCNFCARAYKVKRLIMVKTQKNVIDVDEQNRVL